MRSAKCFVMIFFFFFFFLSSTSVHGAIIQAANCSRAAVGAAVNSASDGDTVVIPAGTCTWAGSAGAPAITISNKILELHGAGIDQTTIVDGTTDPNLNAARLLNWTTKDGGVTRMTGITWQGGGAADNFNKGMINFDGTSHNLRIDHNKFVPTTTSALFLDGFIWGVVDHNTFDLVKPGIYVFHSRWNNTGDFGDVSWASATRLGTNQAIFVEDNTFTSTAPYVWAIDGWSGSRVVFRYNTLRNAFFANHGTESSGRYRSQRSFEVYNNTINFTITQSPSMVAIRGGVGVVYNNTGTWSAPGSADVVADLQYYRATQSFAPWGQCSGTNPWDGNQLSSWPCLDQVGRGQGTLIGTLSDGFTPAPVQWPQQIVDPTYAWNNTINGSLSKMISNVPSVMVENRDFFNSPKPGYTPYTYPHPLVAPPPAAPSNLRVQ